jgi:hypothetical protein
MTYYLVLSWPTEITIEEYDTYQELAWRVEDLDKDPTYKAKIRNIISGMSIKVPRKPRLVEAGYKVKPR